MANNIENLKKDSIRIYNGMMVVFPQYSKEATIVGCSVLSELNGFYAVNNETVCFISGNEMYVAPLTPLMISKLERVGFIKKDFLVPFSNGDFPKYEQDDWNALKRKASNEYLMNFKKACIEYSDTIMLCKINPNILENCLEIPYEGIACNKFGYKSRIYPIIDKFNRDFSKIGTYSINNGVVVFIDHEGSTYVTKIGKNIHNELRSCGYKNENSWFVPLSNGEEIEDFKLRDFWESI